VTGQDPDGWFRPYPVPSPPPSAPPPAGPPGRHSGRPAAGAPPGPAADDDGDEDQLIRPFLVTGGRTRTDDHTIRVESLIRTAGGADGSQLRFEARRIVDLCRRPTSLAELSAALKMPIGVIRVLVGDLVANETVAVVQVEEISLSLLERIRDRVRAL